MTTASTDTPKDEKSTASSGSGSKSASSKRSSSKTTGAKAAKSTSTSSSGSSESKPAAKPQSSASPTDVLESRHAQRGVKVDHMTTRRDGEAHEGHFVSIDLSNTAAKKAVEALIGEGNARFGNGDYGVFVGVGEREQDGYPKTCTVWLRDANAVQVSGIPYEALSPAEAGRR